MAEGEQRGEKGSVPGVGGSAHGGERAKCGGPTQPLPRGLCRAELSRAQPNRAEPNEAELSRPRPQLSAHRLSPAAALSPLLASHWPESPFVSGGSSFPLAGWSVRPHRGSALFSAWLRDAGNFAGGAVGSGARSAEHPPPHRSQRAPHRPAQPSLTGRGHRGLYAPFRAARPCSPAEPQRRRPPCRLLPSPVLTRPLLFLGFLGRCWVAARGI